MTECKSNSEPQEETRLMRLVDKSNSIQNASSDLLRTVRSRIERAFGTDYTNMPPESVETLEEESIPDIQAIEENMSAIANRLKLIHGWLEGLYQKSEGSVDSEKKAELNPLDRLREHSKNLVTFSQTTRNLMSNFIMRVTGEEEVKEGEEQKSGGDDDVSMTDNDLDIVSDCLERIRCLIASL